MSRIDYAIYVFLRYEEERGQAHAPSIFAKRLQQHQRAQAAAGEDGAEGRRHR